MWGKVDGYDEFRAYDSGKPVKYSVSLEMLKTMA